MAACTVTGHVSAQIRCATAARQAAFHARALAHRAQPAAGSARANSQRSVVTARGPSASALTATNDPAALPVQYINAAHTRSALDRRLSAVDTIANREVSKSQLILPFSPTTIPKQVVVRVGILDFNGTFY